MNSELFKTIGNKKVYDLPLQNVYVATTGMEIDADGSPRAYHVDSKIALDHLHHAGHPGNWWALATDNEDRDGTPLLQSENDPAPGYYISTTALYDDTKKYDDPSRYLNSEKIPYIVIPPRFSKDFRLGDIALIINKKNNRRCFAICGDIGPGEKFGEGSICLANQLGIDSNAKTGGTPSGVIYILIKNSGKGNGVLLTKEEIEKLGKSKLPKDVVEEILR
jgi:hypothetical protein